MVEVAGMVLPTPALAEGVCTKSLYHVVAALLTVCALYRLLACLVLLTTFF